MGAAEGRWTARVREKLKLAKGPTPKIVPQGDEKPLVYLSHTVVHTRELEEEFLRCSGVRYRCFSFVYIDPQAIYWSQRALEAYETDIAHGNHIMMDSGAFSFQMFLARRTKDERGNLEKLREQTIDQYVRFCKKRAEELDFYVTFDYAPKVEVVWEMTKLLEKKGLSPVPVYHGDASVDWLKRYLDAGYKRVGVSPGVGRRMTYKGARRCLDEVFRVAEGYKVKLHGFGMTAPALVYAYPWHSVDSSSWSRVASIGGIYVLDQNRGSLATVHLSLTGGLKSSTDSATSLSPGALKSIRGHVENLGWDFDLLRRSLSYRFCFNGWVFANLNSYRKNVKESYVKWGKLL